MKDEQDEPFFFYDNKVTSKYSKCRYSASSLVRPQLNKKSWDENFIHQILTNIPFLDDEFFEHRRSRIRLKRLRFFSLKR